MNALPAWDASESLAERAGAQVRGLCARYGIKQADVARLLGVSQSQVSQRFRGMFAFTLPELEIVADWFHTSPAVLLGYAVEPQPRKPDLASCAHRGSNPGPED